MKNFKNAICLILTFLLGQQSLFSQSPIDFTQANIANNERLHWQNRNNFSVTGAGANLDITYHRCEWTVAPNQAQIRGSVTTYFKTIGNVNSISFDLSAPLVVDSVIFRRQRLNSVTRNGDILNITLPNSIANGALDSVTIAYNGVPPSTGFGSFVATTHGNNVPILSTLSPPYGGRDWWPCKLDLNDKIDSLDILIKVPTGNRAASNGLLVRELQIDSSTKLFHWRHRYPITSYLVCMAVTNYESQSFKIGLSRGDSLDILNYNYPESRAQWQADAQHVAPIMRLFDSLFTPYPYKREKYGHAQWNWSGGMEHQTMSFMQNIGWGLTAHELAHQWFGDQVTCGSWRDIWLNEGFATYLTGLTYERLSDPFYWKSWRQQTLTNVVSRAGGSVWVTDTTSVNRIFDSRLTYNKGAYVLHQLRWFVGDSAFFAGVRNYLRDPQLSYGYASTADLKRHMEAASRRNLTNYFDRWFSGEGYPNYTICIDPTGQPNQYNVRMARGHSLVGLPMMEMDVPIRLKNINNTMDTTVRVLANFADNSGYFQATIRLAQAPDSVWFDPELWLISKNNTVTLRSGTNGCVLATEELAGFEMEMRPNPAHDELKIAFDAKNFVGETVEFSVLDYSGRVFLQKSEKIGFGNMSQLFDIQSLISGNYLLKIKIKDKTMVKKFVKI